MSKFRWVLVLAALVAVFATGLLVGVLLLRTFAAAPTTRVYSPAALVLQIKTLSQLVTVQYVVEKVVMIEDAKWYGENRVLLIARGVVKAGVDLSQIRPGDIEVSDKKVVVVLPPPQVTDAYLDEKQTKIVERSTGLLRAFDKDLEQNARQQAVDDIRRAARNSGVLRDAEGRARVQLTALFQQLGFEEVEVRFE